MLHFPYQKVRQKAVKLLGWKIGKNVYFPADLVITQNYVYNRGELEIGNNVSIGPRVTLVVVSHPNGSAIRQNLAHKESKIVIGDNVWIGAGAIIMNGVHLANNTIVGAGTVVLKYTSEGDVVVGVPARVVKKIEPK